METTKKSKLKYEMIWKIWKKASQIVIRYGQYGRMARLIVKRYEKD
jgi:hypothetical protein